ncbi:AAA family ATPase [Gimesia aquarii]|uniref:ATP-dependent zinc metalloprotease FtsH 4 n=1 Tax=Gimesia aquarii TaxID=2527964 RepID=A0A517WWJ3_9PLAN|nr:ATP-binding protein [Gimesia aquarii]QDU09647.1 ATP-dependent zinc metalloprotease FtsH 4 [Gimesia aquarii]
MKAEMLKRLVRAIAKGSQDDLDRLADLIVESERKSGHVRLAGQLESILDDRSKKEHPSRNSIDSDRTIRELPISRRHREMLVSFIPHNALEHHIVLRPDIDERFERIEKEFAARERLSAYGLNPRKKVLLYGPPGCGKTLGAKRIAWNTGLPLMKIRFDALVSSYFGESASNLRAVFDAAREQPCVLLLDECDFIARSRITSKDIGEVARIVNTLLQLMEEYDAPGLLIATTNIESSLDEALFRRFDDVFQVPIPGKEEIRKLLSLTLSSIEQSKSINWNKVVEQLEGVSAAHVVRVAQAAAKAVVLCGERIVKQKHFEVAISELKSPNETA